MDPHTHADPSTPCKAIVVTCIDYRLQSRLEDWVEKNLGKGHYDRLALAGSVKNLPIIVEQIEISVSLHHIHSVYLINHEDCGAYGKEGTFEKHKHDLIFAKKILEEKFPDTKIFLYYEKLDGEFIELH